MSYHKEDIEHAVEPADNSERLARYVAGECSAEEAAEIELRLAEDASQQALLEDMRAIWANAEVAPSGWDAEAAWRALAPKLDAQAAKLQPRPISRASAASLRPPRLAPFSEPSGLSRALPIAAVLAAVAIGGVFYYRNVNAPPTPPARVYATGIGERSQLQLDDGTRVTLGVASRLRVEAGYGKSERRVQLEGTALFDVSHDATRAFVVRTAQGDVRVLGTRFDVRTYPSDTITQVVVAEGRVALRAGKDSTARAVVLAPGQLGTLTSTGTVRVRGDVDVARYHAWTDGRLVFESTPLADALPELGRWYGLELRLGDSSLAKLPVTATFSNQPTTEILDLLALSLDLRLERQGRTITFHSRTR